MTTPIEIQFGKEVTIAPEVFIEFNTFQPHIVGGGNRLGNLVKIEGEQIYKAGSNPELELSNYGYKWKSNNQFVSSSHNPKMIDLKGSVGGLIYVECEITDRTSGVIFKRGKWSWHEYNDLPIATVLDERTPEEVEQGATNTKRFVPEGVPVPAGKFDVFEPWWPEYYVPYDNARFDNDSNNDGKITTTDLTAYLTNSTND